MLFYNVNSYLYLYKSMLIYGFLLYLPFNIKNNHIIQLPLGLTAEFQTEFVSEDIRKLFVCIEIF